MTLAESIEETRCKIARKNRLEWNEKQIRSSMNAIASSIRDIHLNKLWQDTHASFEEYCQKVWGMSRQRAYQILGAENTRLLLADAAGEDAPLKAAALKLNDGQAAELEKLPPEQAVEVLREATGRPGKMTAAKIKQAKARVVSTEQNLPMHTAANTLTFKNPQGTIVARVCPHCGGAL